MVSEHKINLKESVEFLYPKATLPERSLLTIVTTILNTWVLKEARNDIYTALIECQILLSALMFSKTL